MRVESDATRLRTCRRRLRGSEVRHVVTGPFRAVPPHPLLSLAPWLSGGIGRRTVVHDPPIGGPREAPVQVRARLARRVGLFARRKVSVRSREDTRIDPRRARRRSVVREIAEPRDVPGGVDRKSTRLNSSHGYISYA